MLTQLGISRCFGLVAIALFTFLSSPSFAQNCSNNQTPVANAGPDRSGNVGVAINFTGSGTDSDGTITAYWFNFGDGSFASWQSSPLASHSFASAGTFSVRLWVKDNCGAMSASDTAMVTITQAPANPCANNTAPIANAGPDRAGNPNIALLLTGYASTDLQNNISHYWWNFGDGQYTGWQSSAGVSHAFANTGTYSVRLWVKDSCGAMSGADTVIVSIVNPNPCAGNTPPNAIITSPSSGLVNQSLNFSGLSSSDTTGTIQSYLWNFGDGQTANGVNVSHSYASAGNKTVTLTLTDSCGAQGSMTRTILISNPDPCAGNQLPVANAGADQSGNVGTTLNFNGSGSSDSNGTIVSYSWNFSDGQSGSGVNVSHVFASAGTFTVTLTVTDNCSGSASDSATITISQVTSCTNNTAPIANAGPDLSGFNGVSLTLDGSTSYDPTPNAGPLQYRWYFGDGIWGNWQNSPISQHIYTVSSSQTFFAKLQAKDSCGALSAQDTVSVNITLNAPQPVTADFKVYKLTHLNPVNGQETWEEIHIELNEEIELGLRVKFDSSLSSGPIVSRNFDFFDGSGSSELTPIHAFATSGIHQVKLTVNGADFQSSSVTKTVHVAAEMEVLDVLPFAGENASDLAIDGNVAWISHLNGSLTAVDVSNPEELVTINTVSSPSAQAIGVAGGYLYLCSGQSGVHVYQSNLPAPIYKGVYNTFAQDGQSARDVVAIENIVLVAGWTAGLKILDIRQPSAPQILGSFLLPNGDKANGVLLNEETAYVSGNQAVYVVSVSGLNVLNPSVITPQLIATIPGSVPENAMAISGDILVTGGFSLRLFDISPSSSPVPLGQIAFNILGSETTTTGIGMIGDRVYVTTPQLFGIGTGIAKFSVADPHSPYLVEWFSLNGIAAGTTFSPQLLFETLLVGNRSMDAVTVDIGGE